MNLSSYYYTFPKHFPSTHADVHTHIRTYIYVYFCICRCNFLKQLVTVSSFFNIRPKSNKMQQVWSRKCSNILIGFKRMTNESKDEICLLYFVVLLYALIDKMSMLYIYHDKRGRTHRLKKKRTDFRRNLMEDVQRMQLKKG